MSIFSDRMGYTKPKIQIQVNSIDAELKNCLWNAFSELLEKAPPSWGDNQSEEMNIFVVNSYENLLKKPSDLLSKSYNETYNVFRNYFFFEAKWFEIYNLLEFSANSFPNQRKAAIFIEKCNSLLEREVSGYRFVGKKIAPITSKQEIDEIEQATLSPFNLVNKHLETAIRLLSDKTAPDYRNSIKESISAIEAICKLIANDEKTTLGYALNAIERDAKITLHPNLKNAFQSLYGYTNDADGIRHALKDNKINADFDEAKFMLVTCSAFVNYLVSKANKAGINIP
jgi:hypothetical protein